MRMGRGPSRTLTRTLRGSTAAGINPPTGPHTMLDLIFVAGSLAFFAASAGYAALCERL